MPPKAGGPTNGSAMVREAQRDRVRSAAVGLAAALLLAVAGAFDTGSEPFHLRLIYWIAVMAAGVGWALLCRQWVDRWLDRDARPWPYIAALTALVAGPLCLIVWVATGLFFEGRLPGAATLSMLVVPVVTVTAAMCALNVFLGRATPIQTHAAAANSAPPRFLERLPPHLRGSRLIAVEAEDHYLRVHSDRGSDLILMRLSDAIAELEGIEGAQTHRSWWVARDSVRGAARGDGRATLTLEGGITAPVSRRYARALREAGWY